MERPLEEFTATELKLLSIYAAMPEGQAIINRYLNRIELFEGIVEECLTDVDVPSTEFPSSSSP